MKIGKPAPELKEILGWVNADSTKLHQHHGTPILLYFWDHTCVGCIQGLPFIEKMSSHYKSEGLVVMSVHSSEFSFAKLMDNLEMAVERYGVTIPVAQDDRNAAWLEYGNRYLPRTFIIDANGILSYEHIGTGDERSVEKEVRKRLGLADDDMPTPLWNRPGKKIMAWQEVTPPTYMGYKEILSISKNAAYDMRTDLYYTDTGGDENDKVYLHGSWNQYDRHIEHHDAMNGHLRIRCNAQKAYAVMCGPEEPQKVEVELNGAPIPREYGGGDVQWDELGQSYVMAAEGRIYHLFRLPDCERNELKLRCTAQGLQIYNLQFE